MSKAADDKNRRGHWFHEKARRKEVVNAAQMYERCHTNCQKIMHDIFNTKKRGEDVCALQDELSKAQRENIHAWNLLVTQIYKNETIRVDNVIYYKRKDLWRFNLDKIEDWSKS